MDDKLKTKAQLITDLIELREQTRKLELLYCAVNLLPVSLGVADREGIYQFLNRETRATPHARLADLIGSGPHPEALDTLPGHPSKRDFNGQGRGH